MLISCTVAFEIYDNFLRIIMACDANSRIVALLFVADDSCTSTVSLGFGTEFVPWYYCTCIFLRIFNIYLIEKATSVTGLSTTVLGSTYYGVIS